MARKRVTRPTKPFDATTKTLVETDPLQWLAFLGLDASACELVDAELSTVTTEADRLIRVTAPHLFAVHQEFQASADLTFPDRLLRYNVLSFEKLGVPIHSVAILLRREADAYNNITGMLERKSIENESYLRFRYQVIRLWQVPVERILSGGLAILPMALISDLGEQEPKAVLRQIQERIREEQATPQEERLLLTSAFLLTGLRYNEEQTKGLWNAMLDLRESSSYQIILNEGRAEGEIKAAQNFLLLVGKNRLGEPDAATVTRLRSVTSLSRLQAMAEQLLTVQSWRELLA